MRIAFISVILCLFVSLNDCRSIEVKSDKSDVVNHVEQKDYSVDPISAELSAKKRSVDPFDQDIVPLTENAIKRVKKSLSKNRMKRLTKPKYLEEKLKDMVEQRPEMKSRIKSKLAERKAKKQSQNVPIENIAFEQETLNYQVPAFQYNTYEAQPPMAAAAVPGYDYNIYADLASIQPAAVPQSPVSSFAYQTAATLEMPATAVAYQPEVVPEISAAAVAYQLGATPDMLASAYASQPAAVPEMPATAYVYQPVEPIGADHLYPGADSFALQNEVPFGVFDHTEQDYEPSRVFSRSVSDSINEEIALLESSPVLEVHPITETKLFKLEALPNADNEAMKLLECSFPKEFETEDLEPKNEIEEVVFSAEWPVESELSLFPPSEETLAVEPFETDDALDMAPKFKKDIPFNQFQPFNAQELFYNSLQMTPDYHFPSEFIIESLPCEEHLWAPLEPVKTYEIKRVAVNKEAIIAEIKSVLGEVSGPIIVGEPGEPVIVRHFAKPYVIEYFERPVVVEHHQSAALNVFEQRPVVVDNYEGVVFTEAPAEPLVIVEEICPCAEEVSPIAQQLLLL